MSTSSLPLISGPVDAVRPFLRGGTIGRNLPAIVLAVVTVVAALSAIEPWPVGVFQDDGVYTVLARSLATGEGYRYGHMPGAPAATHYPPLYPALLALLWKLWPSFPANVVLFKFVNAALTAAAAVFAYRFARERVRLEATPALVATAAFTACAPVILLTVMVLSEPLFLAALFPTLLVSERAASSGRTRHAIAAGVAGGLLALVRTLGVVTIPATALVLAWRRRWWAAAVVLASGTLVLWPWMAWVMLQANDVPEVFMGKYGSYWAWLGAAVQSEGLGWVARLIRFNLAQIVAQGWATIAVDTLPPVVRWLATVVMTAFFGYGWWRLVRRAPVAAWTVILYLGLVVSWPFMPARFTWAIWPLVGFIYALAFERVLRWRPARAMVPVRFAVVVTAMFLVIGYAGYNYLGASRGWWTQVQAWVADRARPLAEWVVANTAPDAVLATEHDVLVHLYTGRLTVPNVAFTPQEHMTGQSPAFGTATLRTILETYPVTYVLASEGFGNHVARGLMQTTPPEVRLVRQLSSGSVYAPVRVPHPAQ